MAHIVTIAYAALKPMDWIAVADGVQQLHRFSITLRSTLERRLDSAEITQKLNPNTTEFEKWVEQNKDRIPL